MLSSTEMYFVFDIHKVFFKCGTRWLDFFHQLIFNTFLPCDHTPA